MKKLIIVLILSVSFIFCDTVFQIVSVKEQPLPVFVGQADNSVVVSGSAAIAGDVNSGLATNPAKPKTEDGKPASIPQDTVISDFKELHSFTQKYGKKINIIEKGNNLYITASSPSDFKTTTFKQIKVNSVSSSKLLVNVDNTLPQDFAPKELTNINSKIVKLQYTGLKLIPRTIEALYRMIDAAKKNSVKGFIINSAYRSLGTQKTIFDANLSNFKKNSKTYEEAMAKTRQLVALPGNSEHHTGLALDIFSVNGLHRNDFEGTKEQVWLKQNLYKYGFIVRYPKDKTRETNATYEPWHIRYVGIQLSTYMTEENLCLEEFYERLLTKEVLESRNSIFMRVGSNQKVFADSELVKDIEFEKVNDGNRVVTLGKR